MLRFRDFSWMQRCVPAFSGQKRQKTTKENKVKTLDTPVVACCDSHPSSIRILSKQYSLHPGKHVPRSPNPALEQVLPASCVSWNRSSNLPPKLAFPQAGGSRPSWLCLHCLRNSNSIARFKYMILRLFAVWTTMHICIFGWRLCCSAEMKFKRIWTYQIYIYSNSGDTM